MPNKAVFPVVVTLIFLASTAEAVVLCAKPRRDGTYNTSVKIREACKDTETQLDAADLGVAATGAPVLRDATGAMVGPLSEPMRYPTGGPNGLAIGVLVKSSDTVGEVAVEGDGSAFFPSLATLYFESSDCSGQPLVKVQDTGPPLLMQPLVQRAEVRSAHTAYLRPSEAMYTTYGSYGYAGSLYPGGPAKPISDQADCEWALSGSTYVTPDICCTSVGVAGPSFLAPPIVIDLTAFTPPFTLDFGN